MLKIIFMKKMFLEKKVFFYLKKMFDLINVGEKLIGIIKFII